MESASLFTCISCRVAFETADEQRAHFATDWHRYNMKRRVASLPPVAATVFNEKVMERREQNAVRADPRSLVCAACSKTFSSENAFRSHMQSRKHREREAKSFQTQTWSQERTVPANEASRGMSDQDDDSPSEDDIDARLATARRRIQPSDCLFCPLKLDSVASASNHMYRVHGFFVPEQEHLADLPGLLSYLGEKIVIGNLCLFCPNGGREFGSLHAARGHMKDKGHCKIPFETDEDRAELADFYDYSLEDASGSDWEDVDDGEAVPRDADGVGRITLGYDGLSLVLPSGRVLGHRSLKRYYDQHLRPQHPSANAQDTAGLKIANVRAKLADPTLALVPVAGGGGAFGRGTEVIKARNAGEATWAKRQGGAFWDQRKRYQQQTRVGFTNNNQKHFRDPLLQ